MSQPTIAARPEPTRSEAQLRIDPAILYWGTPVVLISTANENGTANLAPMSSAWWLGWGCMLGLTESSHSVTNLRRTGDCVLNLPSVEQVAAVDRIARTTGADPVPIDKQWLGFEHEGHKFDRAGLTAVASDMVTPPRAAECPVQMECTVESIRPFGAGNPGVPTPVVGVELRVVAIHGHDDILKDGDPTKVDPDRWRPLIMSFREFYGLGERVNPSRLAEVDEERWRPPVRRRGSAANRARPQPS